MPSREPRIGRNVLSCIAHSVFECVCRRNLGVDKSLQTAEPGDVCVRVNLGFGHVVTFVILRWEIESWDELLSSYQ